MADSFGYNATAATNVIEYEIRESSVNSQVQVRRRVNQTGSWSLVQSDSTARNNFYNLDGESHTGYSYVLTTTRKTSSVSGVARATNGYFLYIGYVKIPATRMFTIDRHTNRLRLYDLDDLTTGSTRNTPICTYQIDSRHTTETGLCEDGTTLYVNDYQHIFAYTIANLHPSVRTVATRYRKSDSQLRGIAYYDGVLYTIPHNSSRIYGYDVSRLSESANSPSTAYRISTNNYAGVTAIDGDLWVTQQDHVLAKFAISSLSTSSNSPFTSYFGSTTSRGSARGVTAVSGQLYVAVFNTASASGVREILRHAISGLSTRSESAGTKYLINERADGISIDASPAKVTGITALADSGSITLMWNTPDNHGDPIVRYEVEQQIGSAAWHNTQIVINATKKKITGLTDGTTYKFRVRAVNKRGNGHWSDIISASPETNTPPVLATIAPQTVFESQQVTIQLSASDPESDRLTYSRAGNLGAISSTTGLFTWDTEGATLGRHTITFTVTDEHGLSHSQTATITIQGRKPDPVRSLSVVPTDREISLSWLEPNDYGSAITHYLVSYKLIDDETWSDDIRVTARTYRIMRLTNGNAYDVRVSAVNAIGESVYASQENVVPSSGVSVFTFHKTKKGTSPNEVFNLGGTIGDELTASLHAVFDELTEDESADGDVNYAVIAIKLPSGESGKPQARLYTTNIQEESIRMWLPDNSALHTDSTTQSILLTNKTTPPTGATESDFRIYNTFANGLDIGEGSTNTFTAGKFIFVYLQRKFAGDDERKAKRGGATLTLGFN